MREAVGKQIETALQPGADDASCGYGWQLWMCKQPGMVRFDGGQGQFCIMDLNRDTAVAIHEGGWHPGGVQRVLDLTEALMASAQDTPYPENPAAYAKLKAYLDSRAVLPAPAQPVPHGAKRFAGSYAVTQGVFNPWIEVAPVDSDFYHLFYEPSIRPDIAVFDIALSEDEVVLTLNRFAVIRARLNGNWQRAQTETVLPPLRDYAATARFLERNDALRFHPLAERLVQAGTHLPPARRM